MTAAPAILSRAAELISGDRAVQHGPMVETFWRVASLWDAYLATRRTEGGPLDATDVAHMMALLKIARTQGGEQSDDDWIDAAGYLACAAELASISIFTKQAAE